MIFKSTLLASSHWVKGLSILFSKSYLVSDIFFIFHQPSTMLTSRWFTIYCKLNINKKYYFHYHIYIYINIIKIFMFPFQPSLGVLEVSWPLSLSFPIISDICTKFGWNCTRHSIVMLEHTKNAHLYVLLSIHNFYNSDG